MSEGRRAGCCADRKQERPFKLRPQRSFPAQKIVVTLFRPAVFRLPVDRRRRGARRRVSAAAVRCPRRVQPWLARA
jgi:hypothetical protein